MSKYIPSAYRESGTSPGRRLPPRKKDPNGFTGSGGKGVAVKWHQADPQFKGRVQVCKFCRKPMFAVESEICPKRPRRSDEPK